MPVHPGWGRRRGALAGGGLIACLALMNTPLHAQTHSYPTPECKPWVVVPAAPDCPRPALPPTPAPSATPVPPATVPPAAPPPAVPPSATAPPPAQPQELQPQAPAPAADTGFAGAGERAVGGEFFAGAGYIDCAIPVSQFRLRYDAAYGSNRPDRAEFFYPKCGCFKMLALAGNPFGDINAAGPPDIEKKIDYQDVRAYLEYAPIREFSAFVDIPYRMINPEVNQNAKGISDIQFGGKYAFIYTDRTVVSAQVLMNAPSGDPFRGLGTNNWAIEPGLLLFQVLGESIFLEAELRDYIPLNAKTDFAGNVLRYGVGASYLVYNTDAFRFAPVVEFVGWTVLDGKEFGAEFLSLDPIIPLVRDSSGTTIVNAKIGLRIGFGRADDSPVLNKVDFYVGYGRAMTGAVWYEDMIRAEFRYRF